MDDDLVAFADLLLDEEVLGVLSLVARQLDDLPRVVVTRNTAVALETLLHGSRDLLQIEVLGQALHSGDALAAVTLLDAKVDLRGVRSLPQKFYIVMKEK